MNIDWPQLRAAAVDVAGRAYAPYSNFLVGAVLRARDGTLFEGVNVGRHAKIARAIIDKNVDIPPGVRIVPF